MELTNYVALSPISFLERAAFVYGDKPSIVYGNSIKFVWRETYKRCIKLASSLSHMGVTHGDIVATVAPNVPEQYELHFVVPMAGAILSALNTKLDVPVLASIFLDLEPKLIFVDYRYIDLVIKSLDLVNIAPFLVIIQECDRISQLPIGTLTYDQLLAMGNDDFKILVPKNEFDPISISFTSGSTGKPKGAIYSHRAAYLNSLAVIFRYGLKQMQVFLWTVDMFRCNGWCFTWAMAALGGTNICIQSVTPEIIFDSVCLKNVTHLFGAPTILTMLAESPSSHHRKLPHKAEVVVAGALPPPKVIEKVEELGFNISHAYGMTEALGPITVRSLHNVNATSESIEEIHGLMMEGVNVKDPTTMTSVPFDGKTIGEIMFKSNAMMTGYFKNTKATQEAFIDGWYRTRDLGVRHENGYIEIKDRCIDSIYNSRGEYISTIEVEAVLATHPLVMAAAVVGKPDGDLGEIVCAFVRLKQGSVASEYEIIEFCKGKMMEYMVPKNVVFGDFPISSTGKVRKFVLRERAKAVGSVDHSNGHFKSGVEYSRGIFNCYMRNCNHKC